MKYFFLLFISVLIFVFVTFFWNKRQIRLSKNEFLLIKEKIGNITIKDKFDIIRIQNNIIHKISHADTGSDSVSVSRTLKILKGSCFDRSLLLQKIIVHNNIDIIPVYLYYRKEGDGETKLFDFFKPDIQSHNIFIFKLSNKWYVMRTNTLMNKLETLTEYLESGEGVPLGTQYLLHVNNRNGKFLPPKFLPDIY